MPGIVPVAFHLITSWICEVGIILFHFRDKENVSPSNLTVSKGEDWPVIPNFRVHTLNPLFHISSCKVNHSVTFYIISQMQMSVLF